MNLVLHGSGTLQSSLARGDQYRVDFAGNLAYAAGPDVSMFMAVFRGSQGGIVFSPLDKHARPVPDAPLESQWLGWTHDKQLHLYTERRLDALLDWANSAYPQLSKTRRTVSGGDMGAWGAMRYGIRRPQRVAAVFASRPGLRYSKKSKLISLPDWKNGSIDYSVASAPRIADSDGGGSAAAYLDLVAYAANPANKLPWLGWCIGRRDGLTPFQDHIDFVAALRATKRPFAFAWNNGTHGTGDILHGITESYGYDAFEVGRGLPLFTNSSLDKNPAVDLEGGINLGFRFRNVVETSGSWSCEVTNTLGAVSVNVEPSSPVFTKAVVSKRITIASAMTWVKVSF